MVGRQISVRNIRRGDQRNPGGKIQFEAPFHVSNVKIICPETKKVLVFATNGEKTGKSTHCEGFWSEY